jgi:Excalibur calcium-binding domain
MSVQLGICFHIDMALFFCYPGGSDNYHVKGSKWFAHSSSAAAIEAAPVANASGKYDNCTEARDDGRWDIPKSDPDYWPGGDRDSDGIACQS